MKKYIFTLIALSMIFTATARKPKNTRTTEAAAREIAAADSLRLVASRQAALIDSLQNLVAVAEQRDETAESETAAPDPVVDPEQAAADSVAALRLRLRPTKIERAIRVKMYFFIVSFLIRLNMKIGRASCST